MRILFLSPRQCWPPVTGGKLREYHLAKALGRRSTLVHVFFREPDHAAPRGERSFASEDLAVPPPARYTPAKIARALGGGLPLPVLNYESGAMRSALTTLLEQRVFDLVHMDSIHMASYLPVIRRKCLPVVFDWHNIESEGMRRYAAGARSALHRAYATLTARRLAALERRILHEALGHIVCSEREREALQRVAPRARVAVIENGVDTCAFAAEPGGECNRLVFVGSMNYHANIDAAVWFVRNLWPGIRSAFPQLRLVLVGSDPAEAVLALRSEPGVEVTGTVEDVRPYYRDALAAIVPLRLGGGTRLKILEAMAGGAPVISTPLGAEGLAVTPGTDILFAKHEGEWAAHIRSLSEDHAFRTSIVYAARELARSRYDWEAIGAKLHATYCDWLGAAK